MQSYLKNRPVWIQFLLFIGMAVGIFMVISLIGMAILSAITGTSMFELNMDVANWAGNPNMLTYVRGMLLIQFLGLFVIPSLLFAYFSDPAALSYIGLKNPSKSFYWLIGIAGASFGASFGASRGESMGLEGVEKRRESVSY